MELLKIQLQDAGRVAAQLKASGQSTAHLPKISALSVTKELLRTKVQLNFLISFGELLMRKASLKTKSKNLVLLAIFRLK